MTDAPELTRPLQPRELCLAEIIAALNHYLAAATAGPVQVHHAAETTRCSGVSLNSAQVRAGDLYIGLPGAKRHGAEFAAAAQAAGAQAVLTDPAGRQLLNADPAFSLPVLVVAEPRNLLGLLGGLFYPAGQHPATLFGVTGTNGKTTTTFFLENILRSAGAATALVGTVETRIGQDRIASQLTTPEAPQLHGIFSHLVQRTPAGTPAAGVMEVSSHAIAYQRIAGLKFAVSGFTNLTQDHLDLHGTMADYAATKAELFTPEYSEHAVFVTDGDNQPSWGSRLAAACILPTTTLCTDGSDPHACWQVENIQPSGLGHSFELVHTAGAGSTTQRIHCRTELPGLFNVSNAALAAVMALSAPKMGLSREAIIAAIEHPATFSLAVPGRMEVIHTAPSAVVDFAHNPDALTRTLQQLQSATEGKLILVFGATGERDTTKRATMGQIAARYADVVIVSDDDPHGEDPAAIRAEVLHGAHAWVQDHPGDAEILEISPRQQAIKQAVNMAAAEDTILLAGRGHETAMDFAGTAVPIDDRDELRHALGLPQNQPGTR